MSEKIYCGNAKEIEGKHGNFMKILFHQNDLDKLQENTNNNFVSVVVIKRKEPSAKGYTHTVKIDFYEPVQEAEVVNENVNDNQGKTLLDVIDTSDMEDDLPF